MIAGGHRFESSSVKIESFIIKTAAVFNYGKLVCSRGEK